MKFHLWFSKWIRSDRKIRINYLYFRFASNRKFWRENMISVISLLLLGWCLFSIDQTSKVNINMLGEYSVCRFSRITNIFTKKNRLKWFILIVLSSFMRFLAAFKCNWKCFILRATHLSRYNCTRNKWNWILLRFSSSSPHIRMRTRFCLRKLR